jgi:hypothetical protein
VKPSADGRRPPRWGIRTLWCLALAAFAMATAGSIGHQTMGTLGCTLLGLGGGAYCSVRGLSGLAGWEWLRRR